MIVQSPFVRILVPSVRGAVDAPLDEGGIVRYHAAGKAHVRRELVSLVGDGRVDGEVYLAQVTWADAGRTS